MMCEWQPIATAPKDGTHFDVWIYWRGRVTDVFHDGDNFRELALDDFDGLTWQKLEGSPSHWLPVPSPPTALAATP